MKFYIIIFSIALVLIIVGVFFASEPEPTIEFQPPSKAQIIQDKPLPEDPLFQETNQEIVSSSLPMETEIDESPKPLSPAPEIIKAVYLTSWSASIKSNIDYIIELASSTEVNAVVIDVKDFSGYVAYDTKLEQVEKYKAEHIRLKDVESLIEQFHKKGIYVIARVTIFQDPVLAKARPDLAVHSKAKLSTTTATSSQNTATQKPSSFSASSLWIDDLGLHWIDPASKEAWNYTAAIARETASLGFDEINFDYVRFPSDGDLKDMVFPLWDATTSKHLVIKDFFKHLRQETSGIKISVDLFGLSTANKDDLGIGQVIEDAFLYFDFVCPMVYPSHYSPGFLGYKEPAKYPYEVVKDATEKALYRLKVFKESNPTSSQPINIGFRPWLQDFNLRGVYYDAKMVKLEIEALKKASGDNFKGFMLWNSWNIYTKEALLKPKPEPATTTEATTTETTTTPKITTKEREEKQDSTTTAATTTAKTSTEKE